MDLKAFRDKVRFYSRLVRLSRNEIAASLAMHPDVYSHKINGAPNYYLSHQDIKGIVKTLVAASAITQREQTRELLELLELNTGLFTDEEWRSAPLNQLEVSRPLAPTISNFVPTLQRLAAQGLITQNTDGAWVVGQMLSTSPGPDRVEEYRPVKTRADRGSARPKTNLPANLHPLLGREKELAQISKLLLAHRLVTLLGPGGVGKTRLALEVGKQLLRSCFITRV